jgi:8-oxo-dGTP pyrophosphatase MutT (NUDIX family)
MPALPLGKSMAPPAAPDSPDADAGVERGILMYSRARKTIEVLLVHPGGPFWRNKDAGAWSIPKGKIEPGEDPADVAQREFREEFGRRLSPWARSGSAAASGSSPLRSKETWTRTRFRATHLKWNGPRKAVGDTAFRRSIARNGLI